LGIGRRSITLATPRFSGPRWQSESSATPRTRPGGRLWFLLLLSGAGREFGTPERRRLVIPGGENDGKVRLRTDQRGSYALDGGIGRTVGRPVAALTARARMAISLTGNCNGTASRAGGRASGLQLPGARPRFGRGGVNGSFFRPGPPTQGPAEGAWAGFLCGPVTIRALVFLGIAHNGGWNHAAINTPTAYPAV
jgi:hypothetical protein